MEESKGPRKVVDCRKYPSNKKCSLTISGTEEEVLPIAVYHAVRDHGHDDTPELWRELGKIMENE